MKQAHVVAEGKVYCALQHQVVDVVTCYGCEKLSDIDLDSRRPRVVCSVTPADPPSPRA